jgi:predicted ribosome quality control (RQC) complex YloA/Tae2 family protein
MALEVSGRFREQETRMEGLREEVRQTLADRRNHEEKRIAELTAARARAENADEYRIKGELIQAHAPRLARGMDSADLPNFYAPDPALLRVELDPKLSPQENAEAYFRLHRKAKSRHPMLEARIAEAERRRERLEKLGEEAEGADRDRLMGLLETLKRESQNERPSEREGVGTTPRPAPGVRRTLSSDGYEIWYGENMEGNDTLTSRLAAPTDIWLHVRAGTSAHVVIRSRKRPESVPQRTLLEAARIAVANSSSKHAGVTAVDYTLKKYVRKPRGSGPGKALYTHEKTLHVEAG